MNVSFETTFERILEIIHYQGDKAALAKKFFDVCKGTAMRSLMGRHDITDHDIGAQYIADHQQEYFEELEKATAKTFKDSFEQIMPDLTPEEKKNLAEYLNGLNL